MKIASIGRKSNFQKAISSFLKYRSSVFIFKKSNAGFQYFYSKLYSVNLKKFWKAIAPLLTSVRRMNEK